MHAAACPSPQLLTHLTPPSQILRTPSPLRPAWPHLLRPQPRRPQASALALRKVPEVNASWFPEFIRQYHTVDCSVAVQVCVCVSVCLCVCVSPQQSSLVQRMLPIQASAVFAMPSCVGTV